MELVFIASELARLVWYLLLIVSSVYIINYFRVETKRRKVETENRENVNKKLNELPSEVAGILLDKADDERPIMLNVSQERLIDKTVEEIEKRQRMEEMMR